VAEGELTATEAERETAQAATRPAEIRMPHAIVTAGVEKAEAERWRMASEREKTGKSRGWCGEEKCHSTAARGSRAAGE